MSNNLNSLTEKRRVEIHKIT